MRRDELRIIVRGPLQAGDVPDRPQGSATELANPLRHRVGGGEDLVGLLVQQQVIVAEMRTGNVPVEVLRLDIKGEQVGAQRRQGLGNTLDRVGSEI